MRRSPTASLISSRSNTGVGRRAGRGAAPQRLGSVSPRRCRRCLKPDRAAQGEDNHRRSSVKQHAPIDARGWLALCRSAGCVLSDPRGVAWEFGRAKEASHCCGEANLPKPPCVTVAWARSSATRNLLAWRSLSLCSSPFSCGWMPRNVSASKTVTVAKGLLSDAVFGTSLLCSLRAVGLAGGPIDGEDTHRARGRGVLPCRR